MSSTNLELYALYAYWTCNDLHYFNQVQMGRVIKRSESKYQKRTHKQNSIKSSENKSEQSSQQSQFRPSNMIISHLPHRHQLKYYLRCIQMQENIAIKKIQAKVQIQIIKDKLTKSNGSGLSPMAKFGIAFGVLGVIALSIGAYYLYDNAGQITSNAIKEMGTSNFNQIVTKVATVHKQNTDLLLNNMMEVTNNVMEVTKKAKEQIQFDAIMEKLTKYYGINSDLFSLY